MKIYNKKYEILPVGISNPGSNCFFNSMLQLILSCTPLTEILLENKEHYSKNGLLNLYINLLEMLLAKDNKVDIGSFITEQSKKILNYMHSSNQNSKYFLENNQNDLLECLIYFLDCINPELNYKDFKYKKIDNLFRHKHNSFIFCNTCKKKKSNIDKPYDIYLNIGYDDLNNNLNFLNYNKNKLLEDYINNNIVILNDNKCEVCNNNNIIINRLELLSEILIIKLPFFNKIKLDTENIKKIFKKKLTFTNSQYENISYKLVYSGIYTGNINSGHYCSIVNKNNKFYLINDNNINQMDYSPIMNNNIFVYICDDIN